MIERTCGSRGTLEGVNQGVCSRERDRISRSSAHKLRSEACQSAIAVAQCSGRSAMAGTDSNDAAKHRLRRSVSVPTACSHDERGVARELRPWHELLDIALMAQDRRPHRLYPVQNLHARVVAPLLVQRARNVAGRLGRQARAPPAARQRLPESWERSAARRRTLRARRPDACELPFASADRRRAGADTRARSSVRHRSPRAIAAATTGPPDHLPHGVAKSDQMSREVSTVDRRNIFRIQRTKIAACRTSCRSGRESARVHSSSRASRPTAPPCRTYRASQNRARRRPTEDTIRGWWAMFDGPARVSGLPGNCQAEACDLPL